MTAAISPQRRLLKGSIKLATECKDPVQPPAPPDAASKRSRLKKRSLRSGAGLAPGLHLPAPEIAACEPLRRTKMVRDLFVGFLLAGLAIARLNQFQQATASADHNSTTALAPT